MKKLLVASLLFASSYSYSQVSSETEFLEFCMLSSGEKYSYLTNNDWQISNNDQRSEEGRKIEQWDFMKTYKDVLYSINLLYVLDANTGEENYAYKVMFTDQKVYDRWVKNLMSQGYYFEKNNKYADRYVSIQDGFVLGIEKKKSGDSFLYIISVTL